MKYVARWETSSFRDVLAEWGCSGIARISPWRHEVARPLLGTMPGCLLNFDVTATAPFCLLHVRALARSIPRSGGSGLWDDPDMTALFRSCLAGFFAVRFLNGRISLHAARLLPRNRCLLALCIVPSALTSFAWVWVPSHLRVIMRFPAREQCINELRKASDSFLPLASLRHAVLEALLQGRQQEIAKPHLHVTAPHRQQEVHCLHRSISVRRRVGACREGGLPVSQHDCCACKAKHGGSCTAECSWHPETAQHDFANLRQTTLAVAG